MHKYRAYHVDLTQPGRERGGNEAGTGRERGGNWAGQEREEESVSVTVYFIFNIQFLSGHLYTIKHWFYRTEFVTTTKQPSEKNISFYFIKIM